MYKKQSKYLKKKKDVPLTLLPKQMAFCTALVFGMPAWHSSEPSEQP